MKEDKTIIYEREMEERCEQQINDCYEPVTILQHEYEHGTVLRQVDPILFRQCVLDYIDGEISEGRVKEIETKHGIAYEEIEVKKDGDE